MKNKRVWAAVFGRIRHSLGWWMPWVLVLSAGCTLFHSEPERMEGSAIVRVDDPGQIRFMDDMGLDGLEYTVSQSLEYLKRLPPDRPVWFGTDRYTIAHLTRSLEIFSNYIAGEPPLGAVGQFLRDHYLVYQAKGRNNVGDVLFTGYYEPSVRGSAVRSEHYPYPLYAMPTDLAVIDLSLFGAAPSGSKKLIGRFTDAQTVVPYYDRQEINRNRLYGKAMPIVWLADRVDRFFLQIQGSGKVFLEDGSVLNVHYHASNGHPYKSIGALLIEEDKIPREEMSMQRIRAYLAAHPGEVERILNANPSYVFFRTEPDGPYGCLGVKVTPGRSIAVQQRIFPAAALGFMKTVKPVVDGDGNIESWQPCSRFVLNQDTGGAIRGPGRADLFWGNGPYAEIAAGHMRHEGELYFFILKPE